MSMASSIPDSPENIKPRHVYIIGSKSIGLYGGYESFVMNLINEHGDDPSIQYHIACKANGQGFMDLGKLPGAVRTGEDSFTYNNAQCVLINVPERLGPAQAIYYDLKALEWACSDVEKQHVFHPIVYILASRIGPFEKRFARRIHKAGGLLFQNPDGHEDWRRKWSAPIRAYWKLSERLAVKRADLVVCDSKNIETYIHEEYYGYAPKTTFIPYGSTLSASPLSDQDNKYLHWLLEHGLQDRKYVLSVGRFVPENNFDIMIREFMRSNVQLDFAIVSTEDGNFAAKLQKKYHYQSDPRIKFVGSVYDTALLGKIRENAFAYLHGHEVGGTNPSLLESLGKTRLNLLYNVCFNREVAEDTALYWNKEDGNLAALLDYVETLSSEQLEDFGSRAKMRMRDAYSWSSVAAAYKKCFLQSL